MLPQHRESSTKRAGTAKGTFVAGVTKNPTKQRTTSGAEILVESLIRQGARHVFAYPGGASMPLHQALRKHRESIRTILPISERELKA